MADEGGFSVRELVAWLAVASVLVLLWAFPDAALRARAAFGVYASAPAGCDPGAGPCTARFADGAAITLAVTPAVLRATQPFSVRVTATGAATPTAIDLQGVEMNMGLVHIDLRRDGDAWVGSGELPGCTLDQMSWRTDVDLGGRTAGFTLTMEK